MPSRKTNIVTTKQEHGLWVAQIIDKPLVAVGNTEEEAIGRLWLDSLGDMVALFMDLQDQEIERLKAELEECTMESEEEDG